MPFREVPWPRQQTTLFTYNFKSRHSAFPLGNASLSRGSPSTQMPFRQIASVPRNSKNKLDSKEGGRARDSSHRVRKSRSVQQNQHLLVGKGGEVVIFWNIFYTKLGPTHADPKTLEHIPWQTFFSWTSDAARTWARAFHSPPPRGACAKRYF